MRDGQKVLEFKRKERVGLKMSVVGVTQKFKKRNSSVLFFRFHQNILSIKMGLSKTDQTKYLASSLIPA